MPSVQNLIDSEASYIGTSGTDNVFNTWIWGHPCYDPDTYPWCAAFQSYNLNAIGIKFSPSASAAGVFNQFQRIADADVQPGDLVVFNWDGRQDTGWCNHIGMVEWFDHGSGYFGTIEGNTLTNDGVVARMTRNNNASYFTAFCRPSYDGQAAYAPSEPVPAQAPSGAIRIHLQAMSQAGGILPEVVDDEDNAGDGSPIQLLAAWADGATLDAQADDLPKLSNPSDIGDAEDGAVGNGISFSKLRLYLWSPNSDTCVMYRVKAAGQQFSWMVDDHDTGGSGDDFAGDGVNPITNIEAYAVPA
jgi:hypothetical protein